MLEKNKSLEKRSRGRCADEACLDGALLRGGGDADGGDGAATGGGSGRVRAGGGLDALVPGRGAVHTHRLVVVAQAALKHARVVVRRHVPVAAHHVVDMVAVHRRVRADARAEAELRVRDERRPLVVLQPCAERVPEDEPADGVPVAVRAVRVELAARVARGHVDLREVADARDLDVVRRLDEVHALEGAVGDGARAAPALRAPRDLLALRVADRADARGRPEAEVVDVVDVRGLAHGALRGGRPAVVCAGLARLGLGGQRGERVAGVPDLVRVLGRAGPDLDAVPVCLRPVGEVEALAVVRP